jgi:hypothetical protein
LFLRNKCFQNKNWLSIPVNLKVSKRREGSSDSPHQVLSDYLQYLAKTSYYDILGVKCIVSKNVEAFLTCIASYGLMLSLQPVFKPKNIIKFF